MWSALAKLFIQPNEADVLATQTATNPPHHTLIHSEKFFHHQISSLRTYLYFHYIITMPSYTSLIILPILASSASAFTVPVVVGNCRVSSCSILPKTSSSKLQMAIDYNDPVVMEEFNAIQSMEYDDVVEELSQSGVRAPADMGDMVCCFVVSFAICCTHTLTYGMFYYNVIFHAN